MEVVEAWENLEVGSLDSGFDILDSGFGNLDLVGILDFGNLGLADSLDFVDILGYFDNPGFVGNLDYSDTLGYYTLGSDILG